MVNLLKNKFIYKFAHFCDMKDTQLIKRAFLFAKKCHKGQKQATGKPYFEHPKKVAQLLKKWKLGEEVIAAGLLHDVVEDCNISLKELEKKFGKRVTMLVDGMSFEIKIIDGKPTKDMPALYRKFSKYSKKEPILILIKSADMLSNIPNIHEPSHRNFIINKSYPRLMMFWIPFIKSAGLNKTASRIKKEFNAYTNQRVKSVLYDYISKEDLLKIKNKLSKIKSSEL